MELLKNEAQKQGVVLTQDMLGKYETYAKMLIEANEVMNLTTVVDMEGIQLRIFTIRSRHCFLAL